MVGFGGDGREAGGKTRPHSGRSSKPRDDLVNEPANLLTPLKMAEAARKMAAEFGLECEVLDQDRMKQLGMGALLGVAQGSAEPPALIVIRYKPATAARPQITWGWSAKASPSTPAASPSSRRTAWRR